MDQSDIEALLPVLRKHPQISIVSDELYAQLTYGEAPLPSPMYRYAGSHRYRRRIFKTLR